MTDPRKKFFDGLAAECDLMLTSEDLGRLSGLVDSLGVSEGMHVLDVGCGTGVLFDLLRRKVESDGLVAGVDLSGEMARVAQRNFPFDNVFIVQTSVTDLPFGDSTFDLSVSFASFPHFSDKQKALREIGRVLRPGARFHIMHLQSSDELAKLHHGIGGAVGCDRLPSQNRLREMLAASDFGDVQVEDRSGLYLASAVNTK